MAKKILNIIESGYRALSEEQDDTIVWITTVLKKNGGDITVVLKGNAVNYLAPEQSHGSLSFGDWEQTHPADIEGDIKRLVDCGANLLYVEEDVADRGLASSSFATGAAGITRKALAKVMIDHDLVWHW